MWYQRSLETRIRAQLEPYFKPRETLDQDTHAYFLDTGLLCFLLGISSARALLETPFAGAVWETFVMGQIVREVQTRPTSASVWFWSEAPGLEADFLLDLGSHFEVVETKLTEGPDRDDVRSLEKLLTGLRSSRPARARLVCRTPHSFPLPEDIEAVNGFEERVDPGVASPDVPFTPEALTSPCAA